MHNLSAIEKERLINRICELLANKVDLHNSVLNYDVNGDIDVEIKVYPFNDYTEIIISLEDLQYYEVGAEFDQGFENNQQLVKWWLFESDGSVLQITINNKRLAHKGKK